MDRLYRENPEMTALARVDLASLRNLSCEEALDLALADCAIVAYPKQFVTTHMAAEKAKYPGNRLGRIHANSKFLMFTDINRWERFFVWMGMVCIFCLAAATFKAVNQGVYVSTQGTIGASLLVLGMPLYWIGFRAHIDMPAEWTWWHIDEERKGAVWKDVGAIPEQAEEMMRALKRRIPGIAFRINVLQKKNRKGILDPTIEAVIFGPRTSDIASRTIIIWNERGEIVPNPADAA